jgi:hypothetical protein
MAGLPDTFQGTFRFPTMAEIVRSYSKPLGVPVGDYGFDPEEVSSAALVGAVRGIPDSDAQRQTGFSGFKEVIDVLDIPGAFVRGLIGAGTSAVRGEWGAAGHRLLSAIPGSENVPLMLNTIFGTNIDPVNAPEGSDILHDWGWERGTTSDNERNIRLAVAGGMATHEARRLFGTGDNKPLPVPLQQQLDGLIRTAQQRNPDLDLDVTWDDSKNAVDAQDWGGLAFDILTDPLTYFTAGLSAVGKVAKGASILEKVAGRTVGQAFRGARTAAEAKSVLSKATGKGLGPRFKKRLTEDIDEAFSKGVPDLQFGTTIAEQAQKGQWRGRFEIPFTNVRLSPDFNIPVAPEVMSVLAQSDMARDLQFARTGRDAPAGVSDKVYQFMHGWGKPITAPVQTIFRLGRRASDRTGVAAFDEAVKEGAELARTGIARDEKALHKLRGDIKQVADDTGIPESELRQTVFQAVENARIYAEGDVEVLDRIWGNVSELALHLSRTGLNVDQIAPIAAGIASVNNVLLREGVAAMLPLRELGDESLGYMHRMLTKEGKEWLEKNRDRLRKASGGLEYDARSGMFTGRLARWKGRTVKSINEEMENALGKGVKFFSEDPIEATRYAIHETHKHIGNAYVVTRIAEQFGGEVGDDVIDLVIDAAVDKAAGKLGKAEESLKRAREARQAWETGRKEVRSGAKVAQRQKDEIGLADARVQEARVVTAESQKGSRTAYQMGRDHQARAVQVAEELLKEATAVAAQVPGALPARAGLSRARAILRSATTHAKYEDAARALAESMGATLPEGGAHDAVKAAEQLVELATRAIKDNPAIAEADKILRQANAMLAEARQAASRVETFELHKQLTDLTIAAAEARSVGGIGGKFITRAMAGEIEKAKKLLDELKVVYEARDLKELAKAARAAGMDLEDAIAATDFQTRFKSLEEAKDFISQAKAKSVRDARAALSRMRSELRKDAPAALHRMLDRAWMQSDKVVGAMDAALVSFKRPVGDALRSKARRSAKEVERLTERFAKPENVIPKSEWAPNSALQMYLDAGLRIRNLEEAARLSQMAVPKAAYDAVTRTMEFQKAPHQFWQQFHKFTQWMKKAVTAPFPMYHGRNFLENTSKMLFEGISPTHFRGASALAWRAVDPNVTPQGPLHRAMLRIAKARQVHAPDLPAETWKLLQEEGGFETVEEFAAWAKGSGLMENRATGEFGQDMTRMLPGGPPTPTSERVAGTAARAGRAVATGGGLLDDAMLASGATDNVFRLNAFLDRLAKGYGREGALNDVKRVFFDYRNLGRWESRTVQRWGFFYNFYRNNMRYLTQFALRHPVLTKQINSLFVDDHDDARHSWLSDYGSFRVAGYDVSLGFLPMQQFKAFDLAEGTVLDKIGGKLGQGIGMLNPAYTSALNMAFKTDLWSGNKLEYMDRAPNATFGPKWFQDMIGLRETTRGTYIMSPQWRFLFDSLPPLSRAMSTQVMLEKEETELWPALTRMMTGVRVERDDIARGSLSQLNQNIIREGDSLTSAGDLVKTGFSTYAPDNRTIKGRVISALTKQRPTGDDLIVVLENDARAAQILTPWVSTRVNEQGQLMPMMTEALVGKMHELGMDEYPRHWALMRIQNLRNRVRQREIGSVTEPGRLAFAERFGR